MSLFWFFAGMLTMFAALIVILPWLRTIPHFQSLPAVPWQAPLISLALVCIALAMYHWLGSPQLIAASSTATSASAASTPVGPVNGAGTAAAGSMSDAVDSLRTRLASGGSAEDWELLAKSYEFMGQPDSARAARARQLPAKTPGVVSAAAAAPAAPVLSPESLKLLGRAAQSRHDKQYAAAAKIYKQLAAAGQMNADAWADFADTTATLQGGKLAGEPETYVARALALDAQHPKAMWLQASASEESGRYAAAIADWQQLSKLLQPDSQDAKIVAANLLRDQELVENSAAGGGDAARTPGGTHISGQVSLSSTLSNKATPGDTLFIVAKSVDQPGPPVAVYRGSVGQWPVKFTLDDSSSMLPGRNLTNAKHVTVEARISRSGQAQPTAGDLRGVTGVIDPASQQSLTIVINEVVT